MSIKKILAELQARLPELEWKMNALGTAYLFNSLPKGLFRSYLEPCAIHYIAEIKENINTLAVQKNELSAHYLAQRIDQKINVLVRLCHIQANKPKVERKPQFGLEMMSTRQQWLQSLEKDIARLTEQQLALTKTLHQLELNGKTEARLALQAELGELEKHLTLAKEAFSRT